MKSLYRLAVLGLSFFILGTSIPNLEAAGLGKCPVMTGENAKQKYSVDYKGKTHYFCCRSCIKKIKKNPEKYLHS